MERVSYLAMVEYGSVVHHKFFTRSATQVEKLRKDADDWNAAILKEHGTQNVRCTISEVKFCITG